MIRFFAVVAVSLSSACFPVKLTPECKARISNCLKACPNMPPRHGTHDDNISPRDMRDDCQRHCHTMCP